jgi:pantoate--beta-alanine ligase
MDMIRTVKEMHSYSESRRNRGEKVAFVPTMGFFHDGHLNLMREGKKLADSLIISIYVNPTQFGPGEDFERYPRDFNRDKEMAETVGVDAVYCPDNSEMYPSGYQTYVNVEEVTKNLCGFSRPGHFRGVTTVCAKLFNAVRPHWAIFGKKDYQQYVAIKQMVSDLNLDLWIIGIPTTRDPDGLAMSSRNVYLTSDEKKSALSLSRSLVIARDLYNAGERNAGKILDAVSAHISSQSFTRIDYAKICDVDTLEDITRIEGGAVLALAVKVGKTRLIDNYIFGEPLLL